MRSLRLRLLGLWGLSLAACLAVGVLLLQLDRQSAAAQRGRAAAVAARACASIADRYAFYTVGWSGPVPPLADPSLRADLAAVITMALARQDGVEGGIWQAEAGSLARAFPTGRGTLPAQSPMIQAANEQAARDEQGVDRQDSAGGQTLALHACPLDGPIAGLTAWAMTRGQAALHMPASLGLAPLQLGLGVLLGLMLLMSAALGRTLLVWGRHVRRIEAALAGAAGSAMPAVPRTGERELDRIIDALNDAGQRLATARRDSEALAVRVAGAERLAALGRVAAGVAHEIRNPLAAARLQGENALAGDDSRRRAAIGDMLGQIDRLDGLVGELLAMTQRVTPVPQTVALQPFLAEQAARHAAAARQGGVRLDTNAPALDVHLDPAVVSRILDNLLANAIRHAPPGGHVRLVAEWGAGVLALSVADTGPGVPPEMAERLFEPFVTGRADGTGLGLAIARELADAHGGRLMLRSAGGDGTGAEFALELPQ